ncbi:MAG: GNAT family N-acetyltransferase [Actinomycetota bacterium]
MEAARPAVPDDIPFVAAIYDRRRTEMEGQRGAEMFLAREASSEPVEKRVAAAMDDERSRVVVGTYDDVVFGYAVVHFEALSDGTDVAALTDFVVDAEIRGSGIGEAMMNMVVDEARAAGCRGIDSVALPGDRSTKNFFESFGLKARMLTVHYSFVDE